MDGNSSTSGRSMENEGSGTIAVISNASGGTVNSDSTPAPTVTTALSTSGPLDSAGQATSLSSLEEIAAPGLAKRARRRPTLDRQHSDSRIFTVCGEDGGSERVRFDDHVSFIEADPDTSPTSGNCGTLNSRGLARRKRNKELEPEAQAQKCCSR